MLLRHTYRVFSASMATGTASPAPYVINKDNFKQILKVPALRVPKQKCNDYMKSLRG
jgi:hypothetical protein